MSKLFAIVAAASLLLFVVSCAANTQQAEIPTLPNQDIETNRVVSTPFSKNNAIEQWRSDAVAYIDEIILHAKDESDTVSTEYNEFVVIQSIETLENIKIFISNAKTIMDTTGIPRAPSPTPAYQVGKMPWSCYEGFEFEYDNPYQLISVRFTETDTQEFLDYLNKIIAASKE